MAQNIILKRSSLPGKSPDINSLNIGEIAVNTYDGKLFIKRSGNVDSVETILTTNSVTTGSITVTQTGSFAELVITQDANISRDLYVTNDIIGAGDIDISGDITGSSALFSGSLILSGSQTITNNLTVLGTVNARQFNISVISSSVLFESGSSNFGNTSDDTHSFTGSVSITGSFLLNGEEVGGEVLGTFVFPNAFDFNVDDPTFGDFNSASLAYNLNFGDVETVGSPIHFVGGLSNLADTTVILPTSRSIDFVVDNKYVASIASQSFYTNTTFTASLQEGHTLVGNSSGVTYAVATSSFGGVLPNGVVSGSSQITFSGLTGLPSGLISGSLQIINILDSLNTFTASQSTASLVTSITNLNTATSSYETKGRGIVSGSSQLTSSALATTGSNSFIGNQNISGTIFLTGSIIPSGSFVYDLGSEANSFRDIFLSTGSIRFHNPDGSEQGRITVDARSGDISLLKTAGLTNEQKATIGQGNINPDFLSAVSASNLFVQNKIVLPIGGTVHGINLSAFSASVSSTIINQNSATSSYEIKGRGIVSGSSQILGGSGIVSGSSQILGGSGIVSGSSQTILNLPTGTVSGSSQVDVMSATNITRLATTGSNTFVGTQTMSGSLTINGTGAIVGSGTANYVTKFTSSTGIGNSQIFDNGTQVGINTANASSYGTQRFLVVSSAASQIARFTDGTNGDLVFDFPSSTISRITAQFGTGGNLVFANGTGFIERMRISATGAVGIAVTPITDPYTASGGGWKTVQFGKGGILGAYATDNESMSGFNTYVTTDGTNKAIISSIGGTAIRYYDDRITFNTLSTSGTAQTQTERMRITSGGNVGIGTTAPSSDSGFVSIYIGGSSGGQLILGLSGGGASNRYLLLQGDSTAASVLAVGNRHLDLYSNGAERMRITSGGNVGIGNTGFSNTRVTITGISTTSSNYGLVVNNSSNANLFSIRDDGLVTASTINASNFFSATGTQVIQINTWTTFYTLAADQGMYTISIGLGENVFETWYAYGTVFTAFSRAVFQSLNNGTLVQMRLSGIDVQVLLGSGAGFARNLNYKILRS